MSQLRTPVSTWKAVGVAGVVLLLVVLLLVAAGCAPQITPANMVGWARGEVYLANGKEMEFEPGGRVIFRELSGRKHASVCMADVVPFDDETALSLVEKDRKRIEGRNGPQWQLVDVTREKRKVIFVFRYINKQT